VETIKLNSAPNCLKITDRKDKIIVGMNSCLKIIDLAKPKTPLCSFESDFKGNVTAVGCFGSEDKIVYTACEDGGLRIFDTKTKNVVKMHKNNKSINCAALHPNEGSIVFGDEDGVLTRWDLYK
jgi:G protein beta subunit-like protein